VTRVAAFNVSDIARAAQSVCLPARTCPVLGVPIVTDKELDATTVLSAKYLTRAIKLRALAASIGTDADRAELLCTAGLYVELASVLKGTATSK
jgi:hypothetical protein